MSDDLISRQAAEMALIEKGQHSRRYKWGEIWELNGLEIREVLDNLPSVQPKEKTGHWTIIGKVLIPLFRGGYEHEFKYKCSECGFEHALPVPKNFCPNCGAKMEG